MSAFIVTQKNPDANIRIMPRAYVFSLSGLFLGCKPLGAGGVEKGDKFPFTKKKEVNGVGNRPEGKG